MTADARLLCTVAFLCSVACAIGATNVVAGGFAVAFGTILVAVIWGH